MAFWAHMNLPTGSSLKRIVKTDAVCRSCEVRRGHPAEGKDRKVTVREHHRPGGDACARNLIRTSAPCNKLAPIKSGSKKDGRSRPGRCHWRPRRQGECR